MPAVPLKHKTRSTPGFGITSGRVHSTIRGDKELLALFRTLSDKGKDRVIAAGLKVYLKAIVKEVRRLVPSKYAHVRKLVKSKFRQRSGKVSIAKAGFGVSRPGGKNRGSNRKGGKGVGMEPSTVHWWVLSKGAKVAPGSTAPKRRETKDKQNRGIMWDGKDSAKAAVKRHMTILNRAIRRAKISGRSLAVKAVTKVINREVEKASRAASKVK